MRILHKILWTFGFAFISIALVIFFWSIGREEIMTGFTFVYLFSFMFYFIGEYIGKTEERELQEKYRKNQNETKF